MNELLHRFAVVPRGLVTVAVVAAAVTVLAAVCGMVVWMLLRPRHAAARR